MAGYSNAAFSDFNGFFFKEQMEQMFTGVQVQMFNSNEILSKGNIL